MKGIVTCPNQMRPVRPIIACDVDDVVADLITEWLRRYCAEWQDDLTPEKLTSWMITDHVKPECGYGVFKYLTDPKLYESVMPFPGALEAIQELREIGRVIFVTSCEGRIQRDQKYGWLREHGFLGDRQGADYITAKDKWLIGADFLIDDALHNVEAFPRHSLLVTRPHNRLHTPKRGVRIESLSEAAARIRILLN